jgi:galactoside O-acetyltransferase
LSNEAGRFLDRSEAEAIGFSSLGRDVQIDREARFLFPERIEIGDRTRIDMGALISAGPAGVSIDYNVHVAAHALVFGGGGRVAIGPFCNLSSQVRLYTVSDDFLGDFLAGPTVPDELKNVHCGDVLLDACVLIGSGSLVLPGVSMGEGAVSCAHTVISENVDAGAVMVGHPARKIRQRSVWALRTLQRRYLESIGETDRASAVAGRP